MGNAYAERVIIDDGDPLPVNPDGTHPDYFLRTWLPERLDFPAGGQVIELRPGAPTDEQSREISLRSLGRVAEELRH